MESDAAGSKEQLRSVRPEVTAMAGRVALGPLRADLLATYRRWHEELTALRALASPPDLDLTDNSWFGDLPTSEEHRWFTIYEVKTWRPIGITGLVDIDPVDRSAEYFFQIADVVDQGNDYGAEASRLMLDYAFTVLGLESLFLMSYEFNLADLRACETAGFREFGRQRQAHLIGGRLWDIVYLECLAAEFTGRGAGGSSTASPPS